MKKIACWDCGSVKGVFRNFHAHWNKGIMYYWVCECGANHGHGNTEDKAYEEWRQFILSRQKQFTTAKA